VYKLKDCSGFVNSGLLELLRMPRNPSKRPRRKAKQQRAQRTVDALLEAAARVLQRRGYAAATTNRIAEAAGVSVGTLYEYFVDKDAVFDSLIERQLEAIVSAIRTEELEPGTSLASTLERMLRLAMGAMSGGPSFIRALEQVPGAAFRRRLAAARQQVIGFIQRVLETHREDLRVTDLELAAFVVVSTAEGIASNASDALFDDRLVHEIGSLLNLYLTGEAAPNPPIRATSPSRSTEATEGSH
jgi:AcrR family transcriptional regulator